jgi:hypothetical protein
LPAKIALKIPDPASEVTVDGAPAGKAGDYRTRRLVLRPGKHRIEVRAPDGSVEVREAELGPGDQIALELGGTK